MKRGCSEPVCCFAQSAQTGRAARAFLLRPGTAVRRAHLLVHSLFRRSQAVTCIQDYRTALCQDVFPNHEWRFSSGRFHYIQATGENQHCQSDLAAVQVCLARMGMR